jgi:macrophage erythroblast attacher
MAAPPRAGEPSFETGFVEVGGGGVAALPGAGAAGAWRRARGGAAPRPADPPPLQVPFEALRRTTRDRKYAVDELASVAVSLRGAATDDATAALDAATARLAALKRKLGAAAVEEAGDAARVRARLAHAAEGGPPARGAMVEWAARRADRLVADDLARRGRLQAAHALVEEVPALAPLVDLAALDAATPARAGLAARDPGPALAWCAAHAPRLARMKSPLPFRLRLQQLVELVRSGDRAAALAHARSHLAPHADRHMDDLRRGVALLAFGAGAKPARYAALLEDARWADLSSLLAAEVARVHAMPAASQLWAQLEAGLVALNPPPGAGPPARGDPLADPSLAALAAPLPHARRLHSRLVCGLTGAAMDDGNPPAALPSGAVYSLAALEARAVDGVIPDPETGEGVPVGSLRRAYVS